MSRGYRSFLAALSGIAALFTAFGAGCYLTGLNYPQQERYQRYENAPDDPGAARLVVTNQAKAAEYREPCTEPKGREESDLCAQWKAARAAESNALWAKVAAIIGIFSAFGIVAALVLTVDSNRIARRIGEAQVRCYLSIKSAHYCIDKSGCFVLTIVVLNSGRSPARGFRWNFAKHCRTINYGGNSPELHWIEEMKGIGTQSRDIAVGESEPLQQVNIGASGPLDADQRRQFSEADSVMTDVRVDMAWEDVFGQQFKETWRFQSYYRVEIDKEIPLHPSATAVARSA